LGGRRKSSSPFLILGRGRKRGKREKSGGLPCSSTSIPPLEKEEKERAHLLSFPSPKKEREKGEGGERDTLRTLSLFIRGEKEERRGRGQRELPLRESPSPIPEEKKREGRRGGRVPHEEGYTGRRCAGHQMSSRERGGGGRRQVSDDTSHLRKKSKKGESVVGIP